MHGTDVSNPYLYYDNGVLGVFEPGTDSTVTNLGWDGTYYNHADLTEPIDSDGTNFIVTLNIDSGASAPSVKLILEDSEDGGNPGIEEQTGQTDVDIQPFTNTDFEGNLRYLVTADIVTLDTSSQPAAANVTVGNNEVAVYAFSLTTPGAATMENVNFLLTGTAEDGTHISGVSLYRDEGTIANSYDGLDVLVANLSYISGYLKNTSTLSEPIDSGGVDYIVTVDVIGGDGQVITMALEAAPGANEGVGLEWPDTISFAQTPGNNFTIVPGAGPSDPPVLANPLSGTSAQRTGMGLVDAFYSGLDPNFGAVDYVTASCQYSLTNGGSWTQATNGGPSWEYFTDSAQDFSFIWNAAADVTDENNSAYVRIEVKDADDNYSGSWTTQSAIAIDTKAPVIPGNLQNDALTPNSIDISWAVSSGDGGGNWLRYEIYHRPCDGCALDNNQSNGEIQNTVISSAATSTTVGGLSPNTTYTMNIWAADSFNNVAVAGGALTFTTLPAVDTVIVSNYNASLIETNNVEKGQRYAMFGFTLASSPGTASLNNATIHLDPASTGDQNDIGSVTLYEDNGTMLGRYDGSDTSVGNMAWDGTDAYTLTNAPADYEIGTSESEFIMAVTPAIGATDNNMLQFTFSNAATDVTVVSPDTVAAISPTFNGPQYTINPDTLTAVRHFLNISDGGNVQRGQTYAMFGVNLSSSPGASSLKNMSIHFTGDDINDIGSLSLLLDNGSSNGAYDGSDTPFADMAWDNVDAYTISNITGDPTLTSAGENLILAVTLAGAATESNTLSFSFTNAATDVTVEGALDQVAPIPTYETGPFTVYIPLDTVTVTENNGTLTEPTSVDKLQSYAMFGVKLTSVLGTADLLDMRIYTDNGSTAVDGTDIESVTLCADDGGTAGQFDGTDTTLGNMTWNGGGGYYELNPVDPNYAIDNVSGSELIVVAKVAQTAGDAKTLSFRLQNAVGTDIKLNSPSDVINLYSEINGVTYTITGDTVAVGSYNTTNGSTTVAKGASAAMFGFNLASTPGSATLDDVNIYLNTGSSSDISSVSLYEDDGNGTYEGTEISVGTMSWSGTYYSMNTTPTTSSIAAGSGTDYIMVVTVALGAGEGNPLSFKFNTTGDVTAAGSDDTVTPISLPFAGNQAFNVGGDLVTVGSFATNNVSTNVDKVTEQTAMFGFTLTSSPGTATLDDVNIYLNTGSSSDISSVSLYEDDGNGTYEGTEISVGTMSWSGTYYSLDTTPTTSTINTGAGTDYIMVATVATGATDNAPLSFKFNTTADVIAVSPDGVSPIGLPFVGNQTFTINGDTVTVGTYNTSYGAATVVNKASAQTAMFGFSLASSTGSATLDDVNIYLNSGSSSDISSIELFEDDGNGTFEGGETSVGTMSWSGTYYSLDTTPSTSTFTTAGKSYIMVVTVDSNATDGNPLSFKFNTTTDVTVTGSYDSVDPIGLPFTANETFYVGGDTVNVSSYATSNASTVVNKVSDQTAMFGFSMSTATGSADLNNVYIYFDTPTSTGDQTDILAVELFVDDGNGTYEGGEVSVSTMVWNTDHYELSANPSVPISTTATDFIMVLTVDADAGDANKLKFKINTDDFIALDGTDDTVSLTGFSANQDFTYTVDTVGIATHATNNASTLANAGSTTAMFGFTATASPGGASLNDVNIYLNVGSNTDIAIMYLYEDDGDGIYGGGDILAGNMAWNTDHYEIVAPPADYAISNAGTDFIVVVTLAGDAVVDNTLQFKFNDYATDLTLVGTDTLSGSGAIVGNQTFTIQKLLGAGPALPPCLPDESGEACNLVEGVPPLPPCLPNEDGEACNPIEGVPPLPPCLPDNSPDACGG